jgi:hypothetical protein
MIAIGFDHSQVAKSVNKEGDPRAHRAYHLRQFFMGSLDLDADAARIYFAHDDGNWTNVLPIRYSLSATGVKTRMTRDRHSARVQCLVLRRTCICYRS